MRTQQRRDRTIIPGHHGWLDRWKAGARWLFVLLLGYGAIQFAYTRWMIHRLQTLTATASGERTLGSGDRFRLFVAGDSVGAGYGATDFQASMAGRIASSLAKDHRVEYSNVSVKGAQMVDLLEQPLPVAGQDLVVLVVGSNDLLHLTPLDRLREQTRAVLARYGQQAERLVLIGPGVVSDAGAVPWILRPILQHHRPANVGLLRGLCAEGGAIYVDPADVSPAFAASFGDTVSEVDRFHPSDEGHRWWARRVLDELAANPEASPLFSRSPPAHSASCG